MQEPEELLIYTLRDQIEAIAFCPFMLSGKTDHLKCVF